MISKKLYRSVRRQNLAKQKLTKNSIAKQSGGYFLTALIVFGNTLALAEVPQQSTSYTYTVEGQIDEIDGPRTNVNDITDYVYNPSTLFLEKIIQGKGDIDLEQQFLNHTGAGKPQLIKDPNDVETVLDYHVRDWLETSTVKHPGGSSSQDAKTEFVYDAVGQVVCAITATGVKTIYQYNDARYLVGVIEGANNCDESANTAGKLKTYDHNNAGDVTEEKIFDGLTTSSPLVYRSVTDYDELSRVMNIKGNDGELTHIDYNANDFAVKQTDTLNSGTRETEFEPDNHNRLKKTTNALDDEVGNTYNEQGQLETVTDERGNVTSYTYDSYGNVKTVENPDSGFTQYVYDEANNLTHMTDGIQVVQERTYDALNRLNTITYPAASAENVTYHYDDYSMDSSNSDPAESSSYPKGRLTGIDGQHGSIRYYYDHRGNVTKQKDTINGQVYETSYGYRLDDQIELIIYPSGREVIYSYDSAGRVSKVTGAYETVNDSSSQLRTIVDITYKPFGPVHRYDYANGIEVVKGYDQDYQLTTELVRNTNTNVTHKNLTYTYDKVGNLTDIIDSANTGQNSVYNYDLLDRVSADISDNLNRPNLRFFYDASSNRDFAYSVDPSVDLVHPTVASSSNRVTNMVYLNPITGNETQDPVVYDNSGNVKERSRRYYSNSNGVFTGGSKITYFHDYNKAGRLVGVDAQLSQIDSNGVVQTPGAVGSVAEYRYNALNQRIFKNRIVNSAFGFLTDFVYDLSGNMLYETEKVIVTSSGAMLGSQAADKEWVYVNGQPIAQLSNYGFSATPDKVGKVFLTSYYNNHLGVSTVGFNSAGKKVWSRKMSAFGHENLSEIHWPLGDDGATTNHQAFPGQYYDIETRLSYNWHRYYDPGLGRYLTSDPLGLVDGPNTFAYVGGNPVSAIDPDGLQILTWPTTCPPTNPRCAGAASAGGRSAAGAGRRTILQCDEEPEDDECKSTTSRATAMRNAYIWAGIDPNDPGPPIPWSQSGDKNSKESASLKAAGNENAGYEHPESTKSRVIEHPAGHPEQTGSGHPEHHKCPHFHSVNVRGIENIFTYKPGT